MILRRWIKRQTSLLWPFCSPALPVSWTTFVHPEGVRYFQKQCQVSTPLDLLWHGADRSFGQPVPVLTEASIYSSDIYRRIEDYISAIFSYISRNAIDLPTESFLVLELRQTGRCGYYFVDHANKCLFWLDPFDFSHLLLPLQIDFTPSHVGERLPRVP